MIANYHTHTTRCGHAQGTEREYVERAIEGGLKILGFSDHSPYPIPRAIAKGIRMDMSELEGYVTTVLDLKKEYEKDLTIYLGLEAEYYRPLFGDLLQFFSDFPLDYLILGQHILEQDLGTGMFSSTPTKDEKRLIQYVDTCEEALATGTFTYIAHPDLLHYVGDPAVYQREAHRLCRIAKQYKTPLEINFLGLMDDRHYPRPAFWEIVGEEGCDVVFGCDAHRPEDTWNPEAETIALQWVNRYGLKLKETVNFREVKA